MKKGILAIEMIFLFVVPALAPISLGYNVTKSIISNDGNILFVGGSGEGNYSKIQDAIDNASYWDTVVVYDDSSPYYENIVVNKSIFLIGEYKDTTVIDGGGCRDVVYVSGNWVYISGFTIQNGELEFPYGGIHTRANYITISWNNIESNFYGIVMFYSDNNHIIKNNITNNNQCGIYLEGSSNNNISGNFINNQPFNGVGLWNSSNNNIIYKNTIINNKYTGVRMLETFGNIITINMISKNLVGVRVEYSQYTKILKNNFIKNSFRKALHIGNKLLLHKNIWDENYWDRPLLLPKPIYGKTGKIFMIIPLINFDWHPAKKPYDI